MVLLHDAPELLQSGARQARDGHGLWQPARSLARQIAERSFQVSEGCSGTRSAVAVGLVDGDRVGQLDHPLLDPLQLVAGSRQGEHEEEVDHVGHGGLSLTDADGLHEDDVEPRGFAEQHRLAGPPCNPSRRGAARRRANERARFDREARHPRLVAENRPAGEGARGIDRQDGDAVAALDEEHAERVDERALADAWNSRHPDPPGAPRLGQEPGEELLGERGVRALAALDQRYRLGKNGAVLRAHAALIRFEREARSRRRHGWASSLSSSDVAASAMTVPGPKMAAAPASKSAG